MVDAVNLGRAFSGDGGDHERRGRTQVGGHHRRPDQFLAADNHRRVTLDADIRSKPLQFLRVHEAVLENGFSDHAGAFGHTVQRHELRLHVGGEAGMRHGVNVDGPWPPALHVEFDEIGAGADFRAGLLQFDQHRVEQRRIGVRHPHLAAADRAGHQKRAGLDAIGQHGVLGRV